MAENLLSTLHDAVIRPPSGKPAKLIASSLGKRYETLLNELNPSETSHKLGAELVEPLMEQTGSMEPLLYLARRFSHACIPLPRASSDRESHREALLAVKQFGELMGRYESALEDATITVDELAGITKAGHVTVNRVLAFLESVGRESKDGQK